jgi:hypothetical protein
MGTLFAVLAGKKAYTAEAQRINAGLTPWVGL